LSPKFGETFEIKDVPGRSEILFHSGNRAADTKGCILVGESYGQVHGDPAVLASRDAFARMMASLIVNDSFELTIVEAL
jgi:hypothetical protein